MLSGSCLSLISPCKIIEYSFPSCVKFVTTFDPKIVSIVLPISSVDTPKSAAFFDLFEHLIEAYLDQNHLELMLIQDFFLLLFYNFFPFD